jgi:hypothetical protein
VIHCTVGGDGSGFGGCCIERCWVDEVGFEEGSIGDGFNGGGVADKANDGVSRVGGEVLEVPELRLLLMVIYRGRNERARRTPMPREAPTITYEGISDD